MVEKEPANANFVKSMKWDVDRLYRTLAAKLEREPNSKCLQEAFAALNAYISNVDVIGDKYG